MSAEPTPAEEGELEMETPKQSPPIDLEMCKRQIKMIEKTNAATHPLKVYAWDAHGT